MSFNKSDSAWRLMVDNFYSAATGGQDVMSSRADNADQIHHRQPDFQGDASGVGIDWVREVNHTYDVRPDLRDVLREALTTDDAGAQGDRGVIGMYAEQAAPRKSRWRQAAIKRWPPRGYPAFWRGCEDICTGDHACIRLSGCPSLVVEKAG